MQNPEVPKHTRSMLVTTLSECAKNKGLTNRQIADYTGLHESHISRFFANKFPPTLDNFIAIASAIGVMFFIQNKDDESDLAKSFDVAMEKLGRRPPKNRDN